MLSASGEFCYLSPAGVGQRPQVPVRDALRLIQRLGARIQRVVGNSGDVQSGTSHRVECQRRVARSIRNQCVIMEVAMRQLRAWKQL